MFAKQTCDPKIGNEAANELKSFWTEWRQNTKNSSNQCTIRQLEALIRLTQVKKLVIIILKIFEYVFY